MSVQKKMKRFDIRSWRPPAKKFNGIRRPTKQEKQEAREKVVYKGIKDIETAREAKLITEGLPSKRQRRMSSKVKEAMFASSKQLLSPRKAARTRKYNDFTPNDTECVTQAVQKMGAITPNDTRFYRMLTVKSNEARLNTASTHKIRIATVRQVYESLMKEGKVQSLSKKPSRTPGGRTNRSAGEASSLSINSAGASSSADRISSSNLNSIFFVRRAENNTPHTTHTNTTPQKQCTEDYLLVMNTNTSNMKSSRLIAAIKKWNKRMGSYPAQQHIQHQAANKKRDKLQKDLKREKIIKWNTRLGRNPFVQSSVASAYSMRTRLSFHTQCEVVCQQEQQQEQEQQDAELSAEITSVRADLSDAQDTNGCLEQEITKVRITNTELHTKLTTICTESVKMQTGLQKIIAGMRTENTSICTGLHSIITDLQRKNVDLETKFLQARKTIANLQSVPVVNLITGKEERIVRPLFPMSRKRKRTSIEQFGEAIKKNVRVKVEKISEKLHNVQEDLLEAQDTNGYLIQSENNKMTEIDRLKKRINELEKELEKSN